MAVIYKRGSLYLQLESASIHVTSQHEMIDGGVLNKTIRHATCFFHTPHHAATSETLHTHPASNASLYA
jgi:hypothetical protein